METKHQIDRILQLRKEKAKKLEEERKVVVELRDSLRKIRACEQKRQLIKNDDLRNDFLLKLKKLNTAETIKLVEDLNNEYSTVINRFNRDFISIATIGKERQGKSRFLQSVSRLSNDVIPAYSGTSCTGATSVIKNDPSVPQGSVRAVITYKKRQDLINLVKEYLLLINPSFPVGELEFDQIEFIPLSNLESLLGTDAEKQTAYKHLSNIVYHFNEFSDCFDREPETYTDTEEIKKIVAQNNGKSIDDPDSEQYYKYLAVSRADISCNFYYDAGKIRIIDTIGIESTQLGVEQSMLDTIKNESDAAIVVTRPIADPQVKDLEIYQSLTKTFADRAPEKWLFYLINHIPGENDNTVKGFDTSISTWGLAGHMIVNCADEDDVNNKFMKTVLNTLINNLDEIDRMYLEKLEKKSEALKSTVNGLISIIDTMDEHRNPTTVMALQRGKDCFNKMGAQLKKIVNHYYHEINEPNNLLWNSTQKILLNLDGDINPGAEAIQRLADNNNVMGEDVWNMTLSYVRNEITRRFVAIDDVLEKENIRFKNSLVEVFYENLSELFGPVEDVGNDEVDLCAKIRSMLADIIADNEKYKQIYDAIAFLDNFEFNTRAIIIQTVRSQLSIINPLSAEYSKPEPNFRVMECGAEIEYYLTFRLSLIEENLRHELISLYNSPNKAFYAVAQEFYDKLIFAASDFSQGKIVMMSDVWGFFFQDYSAKIWKEQAQDVDILNELIREIKMLKPVLENYITRRD